MKYHRISPTGNLLVLCTLAALPFAGCAKDEQRSVSVASPAVRNVVAKTTVLATIADTEKPTSVDAASGGKPIFQVVFNDRGTGVAYTAKVSGKLHVVHNGKPGRTIEGVDEIVMSPDGKRIAYSAITDGKWRMVIDETVGVPSDSVGTPVFSPDGRHIAYAARNGERSRMVVDGRTSGECKGYEGNPVFSADSQKVAYLEKKDDAGATRLVVSDLAFASQHVKDARGGELVANAARTRLAAVTGENRKQRVIQVGFDKPEAVTEGPWYEAISGLTFGGDGVSLAYVGERAGKRFLVLNDREVPLPDGNVKGSPVVRPDGKDAGVILETGGRFRLFQAFAHDTAPEGGYEEAGDLVYSSDGRRYAFAARRGSAWFVVSDGKEGPAFDRVVTPVFSPDGRQLVYRTRKEGKRYVVVADASGAILSQHPSYELVFPISFTADGKSVAYGVKEGRKLVWNVVPL